MIRLMIGAALAYGAFRIGRELLDSVPDIERGPNAADSAPRRQPPKRRAAARPRRQRPQTTTPA